MADRIVLAFVVAALAVLVLGGLLRALARRSSSPWPRRFGGLLLLCALPVGLLVTTRVPDRAIAVAVGALVLALFGAVRDRFGVPRWVVPLVLVGVSAAVATTGVRFPLGGVPAVDFAWTVAWLALVTTAVANSGNADGQLPSLGAASTLGVVALAGFAYQVAAATLAAALLGALVAFLAYNIRPASLFMGRAGGLFAGFLIAAGAIWVRPVIGRPESLVVNVLLVGVALVDAVVVVLSRLRRKRPLGVRLRDHLAHRLVGVGLSPTRAIQLLAVVQLALTVLAVFMGRGVLDPLIGSLAAALLLLTLAIVASRARMVDGRAPGFSGRVWAVVFGIVGFVILAAVPAAATALASRSKMIAARDYASAALSASRDGDADRAAALFTQAEEQFREARDRLGSVVNVPSLVVPVLGSNMHAVRELSRLGVELSRTGRELTQTVRSEQIRFVDGRVPLDTVEIAAPALQKAARILEASEHDIDRLRTPYLIGEVKEAVGELRGDLTGAARDATRAAAAARIAPEVLGGGGPRRYLLLVENPAELRGTGGLIGNWGILSAADGKVRLESLERIATLNTLGDVAARRLNAPADYVERYGRFEPATTLQNANMSPDFPTVAAIVADVYAQASGQPVDGVLTVDPIGLAAMLELTGPVRLPDWPTPITSANVVDVTLRDAYAAFARTPERADFLGDVARKVIDDATAGDLANLAAMSRTLGRAARGGHLSLWFPAADAQAVVDEIDISGRMPAGWGDSLVVTNTNAGANKLDYYLERGIDYSVTVSPSPDLRTADVEGTVRVDLANTVPSGLPQIVAGPYEGATDRFVYGQNFTYLSVYTPHTSSEARLDDEPTELETGTELGRNVYSGFLDVFSGGRASVALDVDGVVRLRDGGWYELTLGHQPTLRADRVTVRIAAPPGYEVRDARGLEVVDGVAQGTLELAETRTVRVRLAPVGANPWDRLRAGS